MRVADIFFARRPPEVPAGIRLVATSSLVRELLLERFPEREIPLLLNGVNLELFRNPDRPSRPARRIGFLFYQKRPAHKGLEDAVAALERLRSEFPGLEFACAGFRRERWLPGWIKFFPGQDQAALARFYAGLDVFIFPSRADASPNPPLEAMACRCAVVSTETGGYGDFLLPGITALTVPAGQPQALAAAVRRLLLEPGLLERLAAAGYRKACELSVENQAVRLEGILLAAAGERP